MSGDSRHQVVLPSDKPQLPLTAAGLEQALAEMGYALRFNARASQPELRRTNNGCWERIQDRSEAQLREHIAETFDELTDDPLKSKRLYFGRDRWRHALNALLADREEDPFVKWLEGLPTWDGAARLDAWIRNCFEVDSGIPLSLSSWAARSILLAAVWRAYEPGTKHDVVVVLVGPQGIGKSTAFAWLLPSANRTKWHSDSFNLASSDQQRAEALQGRVLVESAEMTGCTRAEVDRLKAFITRTDDGGIRLAYRRNPEPLPRRSVIVGSTNDYHCLPNDSTGNRRFMPIVVANRDVAQIRSWLDANRGQLWAEALHRYRRREPAYLPEDLVRDHAAVTELHRAADDVVENQVDTWLGRRDIPDHFTVETVAHDAGLIDHPGRVSRELAVRIRSALKVRGCRPARKRLNGSNNPVRCYRRPEELLLFTGSGRENP